LTGADAYIADQLFATLDPTVRRIRLHGGTMIVVADTVGFIRELPHELVAAFQSTLTEAREATLLLHVVDASDPRRIEHIDQVNSVLEEIGAKDIPQILVYNKIDRLEQEPRVDRDEQGKPANVWISAARGLGLDLLSKSIANRLERVARLARVRIPPSEGAMRSRLYASGTVLGERTAEDGTIELSVQLPDIELVALARTPGVQIVEQQGVEVPCTPEDAYLQSTVPVNAAKLP